MPKATKPDIALLLTLCRQLPKDGRWTQVDRARWVEAFLGVLDLVVERVNE